MESSAFRARRSTGPSWGAGLRESLFSPLRSFATDAGELATFTGRTLLELRGVWRYSAEILRQAGILIVGSALVVWYMGFVVGLMCGIEANYVLRGYGATIYSGVFTNYCYIREMAPYALGYMLSAKVGCGLVAEIGSMRINDELDAMESMGLNPMRYVIATRLVAAWLTLPMLFIVGLAFMYLAGWMVTVVQIGEVSKGGYEQIFWSFQDPFDILYSTLKAMAMGTAIVLVGMYYGYHASGGPVGVGTATARSMILNMILITIISSLGTMVFWGLNPSGPIGG